MNRLSSQILSYESQGEEGKQSMLTLPDPSRPILLCLSHLRWNFVYQRPQHLMSRFAKMFQVLFFEEPVASEGSTSWLEVVHTDEGVRLLIPHLPAQHIGSEEGTAHLRGLLDRYLSMAGVDPILWYYTPMSLAYTNHINTPLAIYDCMDELSAFAEAPPQLMDYEKTLFKKVDIVFTGGYSLYEAKRKQHLKVYAMPSSVDLGHFSRARQKNQQPHDQANIKGLKIGFYGVIDERIDLNLIKDIAIARPEWQIVMIGPVLKINPQTLPKLHNIHYLGPKTYDELPIYLSGWEVALMPFAINRSTRYISPTKTPEYLAGGRPVVSTPIQDVVRMYGKSELVLIAGDSQSFTHSIEVALTMMENVSLVSANADKILRDMSWDKTWQKINMLMQEELQSIPARSNVLQMTHTSTTNPLNA
jgi:glycosyltransferase involved in cell wall biosynthesis